MNAADRRRANQFGPQAPTPCHEDDCYKPQGFKSLYCYDHRGGNHDR